MNLDCAEMSMDWMSDAVSRFIQSPSYLQPLLEFIDENCSVFEDKEANKLEYTIHGTFKQLVDGLISDYLASLDVPVHEFVQNLARHINEEAYDTLVKSILTVDDFGLFKDMMLKRNSQLDDEDCIYEPMDLELLEGLNITRVNDLDEVIELCYRPLELQKEQVDKKAALQQNPFMLSLTKEEKDIPKTEKAPKAEHAKVAACYNSPKAEASIVAYNHGIRAEFPPAAEQSPNVIPLVSTKPHINDVGDFTIEPQPRYQLDQNSEGASVTKRRDQVVRHHICSQKKVDREKKPRATDYLENRRSNPYLQQYLKRESFAKPTNPQDAEAVKRRETLMKELAMKLKDELVTKEIETADRNFYTWGT
ncbi:cilia- and flagella-associated protein 36 [Marchantia polymorpha subsp. ruderalis]